MSFGLVKHNNNSISAITSAGNLAQGKMTLIKEQTASSSSSVSFINGSGGVVLDSTYAIYVFKFISIHGSTTSQLRCNFSTDSGSNYNVTKTTTNFLAYHAENGSENSLNYESSRDLAQSTSDMYVSSTLKLSENDASFSGQMHLFEPSSSVFVKHFFITGNSMGTTPEPGRSINDFFAGYGNTTSAINAVIFKMTSGNIDSGTIKLYGIKGS